MNAFWHVVLAAKVPEQAAPEAVVLAIGATARQRVGLDDDVEVFEGVLELLALERDSEIQTHGYSTSQYR